MSSTLRQTQLDVGTVRTNSLLGASVVFMLLIAWGVGTISIGIDTSYSTGGKGGTGGTAMGGKAPAGGGTAPAGGSPAMGGSVGFGGAAVAGSRL